MAAIPRQVSPAQSLLRLNLNIDRERSPRPARHLKLAIPRENPMDSPSMWARSATESGPCWRRWRLSEEFRNHFSPSNGRIGKRVIPTLMGEAESGVIEPQHVEQRCMQ